MYLGLEVAKALRRMEKLEDHGSYLPYLDANMESYVLCLSS